MATIDFLLPTPLKGSGGHRTIVTNAEALAAHGHRVRLHVQESRRIRNVVRRTHEWYPVDRCEVTQGWPTSLQESEAVIATTWFTAGPVAAVKSAAHKFYFAQDYEPLFFPAGDLSVAAGASYDLGLTTVVIGRWLQHKLATDHAVTAWSVPFTADPALYTPSNGGRLQRVVAIYQPDKPRRCADLLTESLRRLMDRSPAEVVTVGSRKAPDLGPRHTHLGLIAPAELAQLYKTSSAGLCLSASNPSRVPFEMMACALPVVELNMPNTVYDLPADGCLLARPDPDSVSQALTTLLEDHALLERLGAGGASWMRGRPQTDETNSFAEIIDGHLGGHPPTTTIPEPIYPNPPITASRFTPWQPSGSASLLRRSLRRG